MGTKYNDESNATAEAPEVGTRFVVTDNSPWIATCPDCARVKAKRGCKAHRTAMGVEVTRTLGEVVAVEGAGQAWARLEWRAVERLSVENPFPGTEGRSTNGGSMRLDYFWQACEVAK
jgi:hypothetical protein